MEYTRKYTSQKGDLVIGKILGRQGDHYQVDIDDRFIALLQFYDFEGATKRNRPLLDPGSVIYARVKKTSKHSSAILTCCSHHNKKTWSSGEAEFMELKNGYLQDSGINLARFLLTDEGQTILRAIGKNKGFSIIIGYNGKIWLDAGHPVHTILVMNTLIACEHAENRTELIEKVIKEIKSIK